MRKVIVLLIIALAFKADFVLAVTEVHNVKATLSGKITDVTTGQPLAGAIVYLPDLKTGIAGALKDGDKVTLIGFGSFSVSKRDARTGRNPKTNAKIEIPAKTVVKFKPGKELADSIG